MDELQYISDADGNRTGVIVPIHVWKDIESEQETNYLLRSDVMKARLLEAMARPESIPFDDLLAELQFEERR